MKTKKKAVKARTVKTTAKKSLRDSHTMMVPMALDLSTYVVLVYVDINWAKPSFLGWNSHNIFKIDTLCSKYDGKEHTTSDSDGYVCIEYSFKKPRMAYDFYKAVNKLIGKNGYVVVEGID